MQKSDTMYYIWTDESDSSGKYYANFYGGILIQSVHYEEVLQRLSAVAKEVGIENEEIKWQKVNDYTEERYEKIIDVLLQVMDVVLGAMCFRLNDKHKERGIDGKRAKRNIVKERLYKHISKRIFELHPGFNIGVTTPITKKSDLWEKPYLHWNFVPKRFTKDKEFTKRHKKETAPYNLHE